jgi:DNA mismatch repair protein MutL
MYLIDQHAAHERVLFEQVTEELRQGEASVQSLLEPVPLEVTPQQGELLNEHQELLQGAGFLAEPFGPNSYLLRGVPGVLAGMSPQEALLHVLDLMAEGGGFKQWEERLAYSIACHGAIRAGKVLSSEEMWALVKKLESTQQPHTCPHGRPTIIHLSSSHLEREFGRR